MAAPPGPPSLPPVPVPAPVDAGRRIHVLDALRGFALLGIFLMNIEWFTRPPQHMGQGLDPSATGIDRIAALGVYVLVQGKFWVLFSLLFGMGFALMSGRHGGPAFQRVYLRRCLALLGFGLAHGLLLWNGDILHAYAIAGLLLVALDGIPRRRWPWLGAGLYLGMAAGVAAYGLVLDLAQPGLQQEFVDMAAEYEAGAAAAAAALSRGSWAQAVRENAHAFLTLTLPGLVVLLPMVLGVFMLGAWLYRTGRFQDVAAHRGWFARLAAWALPPGALLLAFALSAGTGFDGMREAGAMMRAMGWMFLASLPLALAYLALFALGFGAPGPGRILRWLAPAGRMALTHYLLQSLVAALLFHGYGLGLWGQVGRAGQVGLVLVVFALQVLASHWWLARFRFGPMEWLWRWISYGSAPPMRVR